MAEKILKTRIQLKYDTLQNWTTNDPVLKKGELAIATIDAASPANKQLPPVMFKVGNGTSKFSELDWASALAADVYGWAKAANKPAYKYGDADLTGFGTAAAKNVGDFDKAGAATTAETNAKAYVDEKIGALPAAAEYTLETGATDGSLVLKKDGVAVGDPAVVKGWAELLAKANSSVQSVSLASGTNNGTLKLTVNGTATDNIAVKGLGSAAYKADTAFDAAGAAAKVLGSNTDGSTANTVYGAKAAAEQAANDAQLAQQDANAAKSAASAAQSTAEDAQLAADTANSAASTAQNTADDAQLAASTAQNTIDEYKTSNDAALAGVKATAEAAQTSAQVDTKISTHNTSTTAHNDIRQSITALSEKVSGRATGYVFKNKSDAKYTAAIGKTGSFVIGDTIYFTDNDIPDQWVVAVNSASPYYTFQDIETEKTDLAGYVNTLSGTANSGVVTNITKSGSTITVTSASLAVSAPTASGTALSFIDSVSQAANGKITATKKTVSDATKTAHGLMSGADKTKLDGIAEGANNYELPVATSTTLGGVKPGVTAGRVYGVGVSNEGAMSVNVPWTDEKVSSAANHYAPSADSASQLSADASGTAAATWNTTSMVTGVNIQRDAKGHVTGVTVDSVKMPANPNTNTAHTHTSGVGLVKTGDGGTSGTVDYKVALASETLDTNAAIARPSANANRTYPVIADKNGKLAAIVPWTDNNTVTTVSTTADGGLKVAKTGNDYKVDIDDEVVFVFDCGSSSVNI